MKITVVGIVIVIGAIVVLAVVADRLGRNNLDKNEGTDNDQPNLPS